MRTINLILLPFVWMVDAMNQDLLQNPGPINLLEGMNSNECSYVGLAPTLLPFFTNITKCTTASNYTFTPPTTLPTTAQIMVLCNDPSCTATLSSLETSSLPNCSLTIQAKTYMLPQFVDEIVNICVAPQQPQDAVASSGYPTSSTMPLQTPSGVKEVPMSSGTTTQISLGIIAISMAFVM